MATLWLIGMMGSGKTTVAPLVAAAAGWAWYDTDREIAEEAGVTVADLIESDEIAFRALERATVAALAGTDAVVACGGGVVLDPATVALMRTTGMVIHLDASPEALAERLGTGEGRPLLAGGVGAALETIGGERRNLYASAAHAVVDAEGSPEAVVARVLQAWTPSS